MKRFIMTLATLAAVTMLVGLTMPTVEAGGRRHHGSGYAGYGSHAVGGRGHHYGRNFGYTYGHEAARHGYSRYGYPAYGYGGHGYSGYGYGGHGYGGYGGGLWIATPHLDLRLGH